jgi:hypothetical protein
MSTVMAKDKTATPAQKRRMARIQEHGCVICGMPAIIHHCHTYMGGGRDHDKVIPICPEHHTNGGLGIALHAGRVRWERTFGTEDFFLKQIDEIYKK